MCARSVISTQCRTVLQCAAIASTIGRKVRSKKSALSSAWLTIHAICSGCRRGLIVCSTAAGRRRPRSTAPCGGSRSTRCVATRSPMRMPLPPERVGQLAGAPVDLPVRGAVNVSFDATRDDLGVAVMPVRVHDQRRDRQRRLHHQALQHDSCLPVGGLPCASDGCIRAASTQHAPESSAPRQVEPCGRRLAARAAARPVECASPRRPRWTLLSPSR